MNIHDNYVTLVTEQREKRDNFRTLLSCVLPRPIAFVATVSAGGVHNLAPFSFFNAVGSNPPAVMFSPATKADGTDKDTLVNLREIGEFVVNVVPRAICDAMNAASFPYEPQVDEFEAAGFTPLESNLVRPRRVAESPVHMECELVDIVKVGTGPLSANICLGKVMCFHISGAVMLDDETADVAAIDLVGRLGGPDYATTRDRFAMPKPERRG